MQAAQSSTLRRVRSFSALPLTMSAIASRPPGRRTRAASAKTRCLTGERLIDSVRDDDVEGGVLEGEIVDARFEELDLCEPVAISQPGRLGDLLVGEVDSDHPPDACRPGERRRTHLFRSPLRGRAPCSPGASAARSRW